MNTKKKIVVVGATSTMAEHCARLWVEKESVELILIGRDITRTERVAADLRVRSPESTIVVTQTDFLAPEGIQKTAESIAAGGDIDIVLIAHGTLPDQAECERNLTECLKALQINGVSPALFAEAFASCLAKANRGTLAIISSVAGDRGRKSNYIYGSAKGMLSRYAQGLQHRFAGTGVKVVLIKPGPTDTPMTAHLKKEGAKLASVEQVAKEILKAINHGQSVAYMPGKWRLIMWIIRHLPAFFFNKLNI